MSKSLSGQHSSDSSNSAIDPTTQAYLKRIMEAAGGAGGAGPSPLVTGASDYYTQMMKGGNLGFGALSGDPSATQTLMNPYQDQVIGATNKQWDRSGQLAMNAADDVATREGAFGGSRHGILAGTALSANDLNRNSQVGGLLSSGFNDAMNRAGTLAGYGTMGANANANLGMGGVGNPAQWLMMMLKQGYMGPMGQSTRGTSTKFGGSASFNIPFLGGGPST